MRDDVLMRLTDRVMQDSEFRDRLRSDLEGTLTAEGFDLTTEEAAAVRHFHAHAADMTDAELQSALVTSGGRQQYG